MRAVLALSLSIASPFSRITGGVEGGFQFATSSLWNGINIMNQSYGTTATTTTTALFSSTPSTNAANANDENEIINYETRQKCSWRPTVQDVERISWGKPAKKKGTGSRGVPHRLNEEERQLFDLARRKGFLEIGGSGWRSQRRDAPLVNSYRSLCDARGQVCIILHKGNTGMDDELVVDFSPLRLPETFEELKEDVIRFVDLIPTTSYEYVASQVDSIEGLDRLEEEEEDDDDEAWDSRPIYQLPTYCVSWGEVPRSDGKAWGKKLAQQFNTIEAKASKSKKPKHVKPGKNRRHGGYGIG